MLHPRGWAVGLVPRPFHGCRSTGGAGPGLKQRWAPLRPPVTFLGHLHVPPAPRDLEAPLLTASQPCQADGHPKDDRDSKCTPFMWAQVGELGQSFSGSSGCSSFAEDHFIALFKLGRRRPHFRCSSHTQEPSKLLNHFHLWLFVCIKKLMG